MRKDRVDDPSPLATGTLANRLRITIVRDGELSHSEIFDEAADALDAYERKERELREFLRSHDTREQIPRYILAKIERIIGEEPNTHA